MNQGSVHSKKINKRISINEISVIHLSSIRICEAKSSLCASGELCGSFLSCEGWGLICLVHHCITSPVSQWVLNVHEQINEESPGCLHGPTSGHCGTFPLFLYKGIGKEPRPPCRDNRYPLSNRYIFFMTGVLIPVPYLFLLNTSKEGPRGRAGETWRNK